MVPFWKLRVAAWNDQVCARGGFWHYKWLQWDSRPFVCLCKVCLFMFGLCFASRFLALGLLVASRTARSNLRQRCFFKLSGCRCYLDISANIWTRLYFHYILFASRKHAALQAFRPCRSLYSDAKLGQGAALLILNCHLYGMHDWCIESVLVHVLTNLCHIRFEGFWHKRLLFNLLPMRFSLPVFIKFIQTSKHHLCHQAPSPVIVRGTVPYSALLNSALQKAMTTDKITLNPWALFCVVTAFCPRALK